MAYRRRVRERTREPGDDAREAPAAAHDGADLERVEAPASPRAIRWSLVCSVPFSFAMSKNRLYLRGEQHGNRIPMAPLARQAKGEVALLISQAARRQGARFAPHTKTWLDIRIQMPSTRAATPRGDAINTLDLIADGIKEGFLKADIAGLDDRWFAIWRLDWQLVPPDSPAPMITIAIGQEIEAREESPAREGGPDGRRA